MRKPAKKRYFNAMLICYGVPALIKWRKLFLERAALHTTEHNEILDMLIDSHDGLTIQGFSPHVGCIFIGFLHAVISVLAEHSTIEEAANTLCETFTDYYPQSLSM